MSDNAKKAGLIAIVVVAIVGAVFGAKSFFGEEQMQVENTVPMPADFKSEKQRALDAQAAGGTTGGGGGGGATMSGKDRDLGGDLSGK